MYSRVEVIDDDDDADEPPVYEPAADTDLAVDAEPPNETASNGGYVAPPAAQDYPADSTALDRLLLDD